jgi:hypothetical protein
MNAFIIPFISLSGILISALISWFISKNQVSASIDKIRYDLQNTYVQALQNERIKQYPQLFSAVETYVKEIQTRSITFDKVRTFYKSIDDWHTGNGLLLSFDTNRRIYKLLRKQRQICTSKEDAWINRINNDKKRQELIRDAWEIELGLKNDIGVFQIEFFDPDKKLRSYNEMNIMQDEIEREDKQ